MLPSSHSFTHYIFEQIIQVGDTVIDATIANGDNTRFLATRVGATGHVISYALTKDNANSAVTSLFMSGLSERVTLLGKSLDSDFVQEMGAQVQASAIIFDYSDDVDNQDAQPNDYLNQIERTLLRLTHGGILIAKFNHVPENWQPFRESLLSADFKQALFQTDSISVFMIERV